MKFINCGILLALTLTGYALATNTAREDNHWFGYLDEQTRSLS